MNYIRITIAFLMFMLLKVSFSQQESGLWQPFKKVEKFGQISHFAFINPDHRFYLNLIIENRAGLEESKRVVAFSWGDDASVVPVAEIFIKYHNDQHPNREINLNHLKNNSIYMQAARCLFAGDLISTLAVGLDIPDTVEDEVLWERLKVHYLDYDRSHAPLMLAAYYASGQYTQLSKYTSSESLSELHGVASVSQLRDFYPDNNALEGCSGYYPDIF